jgi:hypothetical protein
MAETVKTKTTETDVDTKGVNKEDTSDTEDKGDVKMPIILIQQHLISLFKYEQIKLQQHHTSCAV